MNKLNLLTIEIYFSWYYRQFLFLQTGKLIETWLKFRNRDYMKAYLPNITLLFWSFDLCINILLLSKLCRNNAEISKKFNLALFDPGDIQFGTIRFSRCGRLFDQAAIDTWTVISIVNIYKYINYNLEISSIFGICSISLWHKTDMYVVLYSLHSQGFPYEIIAIFFALSFSNNLFWNSINFQDKL